MNYTNARSVFTNKRGRYSAGEKIAIVYCTILGILLIVGSIVQVSPLDDGELKTYRLLNPYLVKSAILIFGAWGILAAWSLSYRFKAFIHQSIGFQENESLFSLFLLIVLTTAYIAIGDMTLLLKNNITYTMKLTNWYFVTSLILLVGIVYTLRRSIVHAKHLSKASVMKNMQHYSHDDAENFKEHISSGNNGGLF